MRRSAYAEDPNWSLSLVPTLSNICLQWIINNFEVKPILEELPPIQKDFVQERLSTSLPMHVKVTSIPDGVFWKRCCTERWYLCDVSRYGDSWKRMFIERHFESIIEAFIPNETEPNTVLELARLCKSHIKKLDISQLLPPQLETKKKEDESVWSFNVDEDLDEPQMDRFNFSILLDKLPYLEELHVAYRVKQCGMNYEKWMFVMTNTDCESLGNALKSCKTLKLFRLRQSLVDDKQCQLLVQFLMDHPSLRELHFTYNVIGDSGAKDIAKLLTRSKLEVLNMSGNKIRGPGAKAIARALSDNSSLLVLNLQSNQVMDEGGQALSKALLNNTTLSTLNLARNDVTSVTVCALSKVLAQNKTLRSINLSVNKLGKIGGKALAEAMSQNSTVTECNIQQNDIDEEDASTINMVVWANKSKEKKR